MNDQSVNVIRLGVAAAVGYLIAFAAAHGFPTLDPGAKAAVITAIVGVVTPAYTALVHKLEARYPWLGHLLAVRPAKPQQPAKSAAGVRQ